ncbi:MAG: flagellar protein FlgN [Desulfovibrionaceae bacterium]|nr:flagellar protein FlgN [Desulfovibrionaceae bacterium]
MYQTVYESLFRQNKALGVLTHLLQEEYHLLLDRDSSSIAGQEFSIQELVRQLAVEKSLVINTLKGQRVMDYANSLPEEQANALRELFAAIDTSEQTASRQASRNAQLSLALLDQSSRNLNALTSQVSPRTGDTYGRRGGMRRSNHPQAAILSGRL